MSVARNDPCPCGSGKKFKKCCMGADSPKNQVRTFRTLTLFGIFMALAAILFFLVNPDAGKLVAGLGAAVAVAYWILSDPPTSKGGGNPGAINYGR